MFNLSPFFDPFIAKLARLLELVKDTFVIHLGRTESLRALLYKLPVWAFAAAAIVIVLAFLILFKVLFTRLYHLLLNAFHGSSLGTSMAKRNVISGARKLARKKEYARAADVYLTIDEDGLAAKVLEKGGLYAKAGQIYDRMGQPQRAIEMYEKGGEFSWLGEALMKQGQHRKAAEVFIRAGKKILAAEAYDHAGMHTEAAALYEEAGHTVSAAHHHEKAGNIKKAAMFYDRAYVEGTSSKESNMASTKKFQEFSIKAGTFYHETGDYGLAMESFARVRAYQQAAESALAAGDRTKAAEFFESGKDFDKAAEIYRERGNTRKANQLMSEKYIAEGDVLSAARVLMEAGEFLNAAEYFDRAGDYPAAGEAYMKAREWDAAAAMFMKGGDEMRAAEAYAKSEHPREAAEIFIRLGQPGRAAELFESAGDFVEAADVYREAGQRAKEFAALQKVKPGDYGYNTAVMKMGEFFKGQGKLDLAEEKFVQAIGGAEADDTNLEMYYGLGTVYEESGRFEDAVKAYNRIQLIDYGYKDVDERIKSCRGRTNAAAAAATAPGAAQAGGADAAKRYTIMREVGRGGMGVVYKAKDNVLDRIIAIKLLPKSISDNPKAIKCFSAEARSAAQLNHTNIVTLYDFQQAGGRSFITMEYVEGVTLKKLMGMTDALQISKALKIIYQCCQGLDYAHKKGIIHRDIKPANIMISKQNIVKIMDFGLAKILGEETLTDTGKVSGTVLYMSPEQLKGEKLDRATDIYSLGLVLYELVTGRHPFPDGDPAYNHVHTVPRRPEELRPEVPAHLSGIVMRCIEKDRAKRFESALQLAMALREAAAG